MSEYNRTYERIDKLNLEIEEIDKQIDELMQEREEKRIELGECEGYIAELEYIDGEDY